MRLILPVLAATVGTAVAYSHVHHRHAHVHAKRDITTAEISVTVLECWLEGHAISEQECKEGIEKGTLKWADDENGTVYVAPPATTVLTKKPSPPPPALPAPVPPPPAPEAPIIPPPAPKPEPTKASPPPPGPPPPAPPPPAPVIEKPATSPTPVPPPVPAPAPAPETPAPPAPQIPAPSPEPPAPKPEVKPAVMAQKSSGKYESINADIPFPDGQLSCSDFPWQYGALPTPWLNLGGWASVQKPQRILPHGVSDILTMTRSQCMGDTCCLEDSYCSYACGEGLLKWQWPTVQGAEGQSLGGVVCRKGKLWLTNPKVPYLCAPGNDQVKVVVKNKLSQNVAVCRTNYPGDENMSVPLDVLPGKTRKLAVPDAATFWKTRSGAGTSAQYYINMPGYSVEKACVWGDQGDDFGNFAPANLGVGISNGVAYVSLFKNYPSQKVATLPYTITIHGGSIPCRYRNGKYCTGEGYSDCKSDGNAGCTVAASSGTITFTLSD
ncbi:ATP-dependent permease [Venturia nashicola]|uniref:ATP-dependent permease n=1 Tax=Venturia nashicola TaxID=86259 RepID=A0A4Z1PE76_9PEZI|nr:ATP-dependent permease [Venturia nashicola]TLD36134.1 ATP-dependent permease [Venturia nashicola]